MYYIAIVFHLLSTVVFSLLFTLFRDIMTDNNPDSGVGFLLGIPLFGIPICVIIHFISLFVLLKTKKQNLIRYLSIFYLLVLVAVVIISF